MRLGKGVKRNGERFWRKFVALSLGICRFPTDLKLRHHRPLTRIRGDPGLSNSRWRWITARSRLQRVTSAYKTNTRRLTSDRSVGIMADVEQGGAR
jgi:hypothetical protein